MNPDQSSISGGVPTNAPAGQADVTQPRQADRRDRNRPRLFAVLAGLAAGLLAFALGEAMHDFFVPAKEERIASGAPVLTITPETHAAAVAKNASLVFAILGGSLGFLLGLAGGIAGRSSQRGIRAGVIGLVLGVVLGAALPLAFVVPYFHLQQRLSSDSLLVPLGMHALFWGPLGAAAGLAFGMGLGERMSDSLRLALLACLGACLGAAIYEMVGPMVDPFAETSDPLSTTLVTRLLARLLVAAGVGLAIGVGVLSSKPSAISPGPSVKEAS